MTSSALKFTPPKRRTTNLSRKSTRSYQSVRYKRIIEEQIGILNLLRRYSYTGLCDSIAANHDTVTKLNLDSNKSNALQFWILWGSVLQIPKAITEFLQTLSDNILDSTGTAARAAALLNVIGTMILIYPTIVVCKWYLCEIYCSYRRGFANVYGKRLSWFGLQMHSLWYTLRELGFARSEDVVSPQSGKDWLLEVLHSVDPPLPIRDPKVPRGLWKRLQALTDQEYEQTLAKPDISSQLSSSSCSSGDYSALSV